MLSKKASVIESSIVENMNGKDPNIATLCQVGGIPGNNYVPGTLVRPSWNGIISIPIWGLLVGISICTAVAFRDKRLRKSKIVRDLYKLLEYAPGTGLNGALGDRSFRWRVDL